MAPRKEIRLEILCLPIVHTFIKNIIHNHFEKAEPEDVKITEDLKMLLSHVPASLHHKIADLHLRRLKEEWGEDGSYDYYSDNESSTSDNESSSSESSQESQDENVNREVTRFDPLFSVLGLLKVRKVYVSDWPMGMSDKLIGLLDKMTSLEVFACHDFLNINHQLLNRQLLKAHPALSNLTSFTTRKCCSDESLRVICENCPALRIIDVEYNDLTDVCISSLVKCENLQKVNLDRNFITSEGYVKLLTETMSNNLYKIGCYNFGCLDEVLDELEHVKPLHTFQIKQLKGYDMDEKYFDKIVKYFPSLTKVAFHYSNSVPIQLNFSSLSELKHLKDLGFIFLYCSPNDACKILSNVPIITECEFHLHHSDDADLPIFLRNISQFCPGIKRLTVVEFGGVSSAYMPEIVFAANAFENLTELIWFNPTLVYAQHILYRATHIQTIKFCLSSLPILSDEFFQKVFKNNPLSELKTLRINEANSLSINMIKYIIKNCEQLTSFTICSEDLYGAADTVQNFIAKNNYDIDFVVYENDWLLRETF